MLGPGVSITHAAIKAICDSGCTVVWCGESASRFYAVGMGETRSSDQLLLQAKACMNDELHMHVVRRMYLRRFSDMDCSGMTLQQIRGLEGIRVREAYRQFAQQYGVEWRKRDYKTTAWEDSNPINQALSIANTRSLQHLSGGHCFTGIFNRSGFYPHRQNALVCLRHSGSVQSRMQHSRRFFCCRIRLCRPCRRSAHCLQAADQSQQSFQTHSGRYCLDSSKPEHE